MVDITNITTESDLGQMLHSCGVDSDPLQLAPELVSNFWRSDSRYRLLARFLRGNPNCSTIISAYMGKLELHEQDPQNFWFHTLRDTLSGTNSEAHIASWIRANLFPSAIAPQRVATVRAYYPHLAQSAAWLSMLLHWSMIDTDPLSRAPEAIQQRWKQMWKAERAPEAWYLRGIVGIESIIASQKNEFILFQYEPQHSRLEQRSRLQVSDDATTAEIQQWVYTHWQ